MRYSTKNGILRPANSRWWSTSAGVGIGLTVCEDIWHDTPMQESVEGGAELIISINASPFHHRQAELREQQVVCRQARRFGLPIVYVNQVGGQDELVFDGSSMAVNADGTVAARLPAFETGLERVCFSQGRFLPRRDCAAFAGRAAGVQRDFAGRA